MESGGVPEFFNISPPHRHKFDVKKPGNYNKVGSEVIERLHFLASLPLAGTAQMEGGGIRVA